MRPYGFDRRPQVRESQLEDELVDCIFCGSSKLQQTCVAVNEHPEVRYLKCAQCFAKFAARQPTQDFLSNLYEPEHYVGTVAGSRYKSARLAQRILPINVTAALRQHECVKILDYGGGTGSLGLDLCSLLKTSSCSVTVVDIFERKDSSGITFLNPVEFQSLTQDTFDVVVASAVVEHLKDPNQTLSKLYDVCRPGGHLYFRVPNLFPLARVWPPILIYPEHLSDLGPRFWKELPQILGWEVKTVYSRTCQTDTLFRESPLASIVGTSMKIPARVEVWIRNQFNVENPARYECSGGWEVLYSKSGNL